MRAETVEAVLSAVRKYLMDGKDRIVVVMDDDKTIVMGEFVGTSRPYFDKTTVR